MSRKQRKKFKTKKSKQKIKTKNQIYSNPLNKSYPDSKERSKNFG